MVKTTKSYACQAFINYYTSTLGLPFEIVDKINTARDGYMESTFSNEIHPSVCGTIRYNVPSDIGLYGAKTNIGFWIKRVSRAFKDRVLTPVSVEVEEPTNAESKAYLALSSAINDRFIDAGGEIYSPTMNRVQRYLPTGKGLPPLSAENLIKVLQAYQDQIIAEYNKIVTGNSWKKAETEHFLSMIRCSNLLPEASGPDMEAFAHYKSAFADYKRFEHDLDEWMK